MESVYSLDYSYFFIYVYMYISLIAMQSAKGFYRWFKRVDQEPPIGLMVGPDHCAEGLFFSDPYRNPWLWVSKTLVKLTFVAKELKTRNEIATF